jgi:hypothetical protein
MNAPTGKLIANSKNDSLGDVHLWRSKFIDKCAKCEREIRRLSNVSNDGRAFLKAMTEKLLMDSTDDENQALTKHLTQLLPLVDLRGEIAHSELLRVEADTQNAAVFQNANFSHAQFEKHLVISAEQRRSALQIAGSVAGQLAKIIT